MSGPKKSEFQKKNVLIDFLIFPIVIFWKKNQFVFFCNFFVSLFIFLNIWCYSEKQIVLFTLAFWQNFTLAFWSALILPHETPNDTDESQWSHQNIPKYSCFPIRPHRLKNIIWAIIHYFR